MGVIAAPPVPAPPADPKAANPGSGTSTPNGGHPLLLPLPSSIRSSNKMLMKIKSNRNECEPIRIFPHHVPHLVLFTAAVRVLNSTGVGAEFGDDGGGGEGRRRWSGNAYLVSPNREQSNGVRAFILPSRASDSATHCLSAGLGDEDARVLQRLSFSPPRIYVLRLNRNADVRERSSPSSHQSLNLEAETRIQVLARLAELLDAEKDQCGAFVVVRISFSHYISQTPADTRTYRTRPPSRIPLAAEFEEKFFKYIWCMLPSAGAPVRESLAACACPKYPYFIAASRTSPFASPFCTA
ncbi:hypothetical protein B0H16DRAFT_1855517 [Mycena metata]|uniref:Uncharacterized protein n=1 Tax=Mycena metata TaxID=1033252 RepID=A0AAD7DJ27_9AGAR|nr:hypothetical protein B0H16DRAFT_1855517 [Mycena metata]